MNPLSLYSEFERHSPTQYTRKCIDGKITGCCNCVGYCQYEGHPGFLTSKHRKEHDCLGKQCFHYLPKPVKEKTVHSSCMENEILKLAQSFFSQNDGVKVLRARETGVASWILSYVALFSDVTDYSLVEQITQKTGCNIQLERLNYDFETCVKIIYA